jgi:hypothetical protein
MMITITVIIIKIIMRLKTRQKEQIKENGRWKETTERTNRRKKDQVNKQLQSFLLLSLVFLFCRKPPFLGCVWKG